MRWRSVVSVLTLGSDSDFRTFGLAFADADSLASVARYLADERRLAGASAKSTDAPRWFRVKA